MRGMVDRMQRSAGVAPALLALVLLFRLLTPAGYMIAPDHSGRPGLVLCAAAAGSTAEPARHDGHDDRPAAPAPSKPGELTCPFAALAAPPLPPAPPLVPASEPVGASVPVSTPVDQPTRPALAAPPPPATGPPLPV